MRLAKLVIIPFLLLASFVARGSHAVGIDLTYECLGGNQYRFNVSFYRDCDGISAPSSVSINISSASCGISTSQTLSATGNQEISQICGAMLNSTTCNGGSLPGIQEYTYSGVFTLPSECTDWVIGYSECCRNSAITNLSSPGSQNLYVEAHIDNTGGQCNSSPTYSALPVPYICVGQPFSYNHGAVDPDGNTLVYSLINPQSASGTNIPYTGGYTPTNPIGVSGAFSLDANTGQMTFTPNQIQQGVVTVLIEEYDGANLVGSTMRDIQVVVINCSNTAPTGSGVDGSPTVYDYTGCAGSSFCFDVVSDDSDGGDVTTLTWNNGIPAATFTTAGAPFQTGTFCWTPTIDDIGTHYFTVTVEDDACPIPGINTFIYEINVTPSPDPAVDAGADQSVCFGESVSLNATAGAGATYTWSPSAGLSCSNCASPSFTATSSGIYTVQATYPSGCSQTDDIGVTINPAPTVSVYPGDVSICSGSSATLTATTNDPGNTFLWTPGNETTASIVVSPGASTSYSVTVTDPAGCDASASANVTVSPPPPAEVCNNIYVTTTGAGSGLTSSDPTDLQSAIAMAQCNNSTIKLATGTYTIDNPIVDILGYTTLEGGFDAGNNWVKTSLTGATTIYRSTANPEGGPSEPRLVAIQMSNASYFRFQDLTIEVADATAPAQGEAGITTYALHMTSCSNYDVVRCQLISGNGANGIAGVNGSNGATGGNGTDGSTGGCGLGNSSGGTGGNGGAAGAAGTGNPGADGTAGAVGGYGGGGGADNGTTTANTSVNQGAGNWNGRKGQSTTCANAGNGGSKSGDGSCGNNAGRGVDGQDCVTPGTAGTNGTSTAPTYTLGFYVPGSGTDGTGGIGGGAGAGGGGGAGDDDWTDVGGDGGKGGGGGGGGGEAGTAGTGGGSSFPVFIWGNGANGNFTDVDFVAGTFGTAGTGGTGGTGGAGGAGYKSQTCGCGDGNDGGYGGNGSAGGDGGDGGNGAAGSAADIYIDGTLPVITNDATPIAVAVGESSITNFNLAAQPEIFVDNISCTNTDINYSSSASSNWDLDAGATNQTPTGASVTTQYTSIGRNNIEFGPDTYTGFNNITLDGVADPDLNTTAYQLAIDTFVVCAGSPSDWWTTAPYYTEILWDFGGAIAPNTYNAANLPGMVFSTAGTYTVTIQINTDCCGWSLPIDVVLIVDDAPTISVAGNMAICENGNTVLTATTTSDSVVWTPNYSISVDTGLVVTFNPPATTDYIATAFSEYGICSATDNFTVTVNELPDLTMSSTPVTCPNNGTATVTVGNLAGPFNYTWNDPSSQTSNPATNLYSGNYMVGVTDAATGCYDSAFVFVDPGTTPVVYIQNSTNVSCYQGSDGTATADVSNGTAPFTYTWTNTTSGATIASGVGVNSVIDLPEANYNVAVVDAGGCIHNVDFTISDPDTSVYILDTTIIDATCFSTNDGSIATTADGGSGGFTYLWDANANNSTIDSVGGLNPGIYTLTITDMNGCVKLDSFTVNGPTPELETDAGIDDTICGNMYLFNAVPTPGNTSGIWLEALSSGPASFTSTTDPNSPVNIGSNYGPYTFYWEEDNGAGCLDTASVNILFVEQPVANAVSDTSCSLTYTMNAVPSVGSGEWISTTPGVTFIPDEFSATADITAPILGDYDFSWAEDNGFGCVDTAKITITFANLAYAAIVTDPSCSYTCDGSITIVSPDAEEFLIDGGSSNTTGIFTDVCTGDHIITIMGTGGCQFDSTITINTPLELEVTASGVATVCINETTFIDATSTGGTGNITYAWEDGIGTGALQNVSAITTTTFTVVATDENSCTDTSEVLVTVRDSINVATSSMGICPGGSADISATATGGDGNDVVSGYIFNWDNAFTGSTQTVSPTGDSIFAVYATDGCGSPSDTAYATVTVYPSPEINFIVRDGEGCVPVSASFINFVTQPAGSTCTWDLGDGTTIASCENESYTYTVPGIYDVTFSVVSPDGCSNDSTAIAAVNVYSLPIADFTFTPDPGSLVENEITYSDQSFDAAIHSWDFDSSSVPSVSSEVNPIVLYPSAEGGTHTTCLTVYTMEGCQDQICKEVIIENEVLFYVPNAFTPNGDGENDIFRPEGSGISTDDYTMQVFNRWGQLIFESKDYDIGWDGTYKGKIAQEDVYVWKINVKSNVQYDFLEEFKGHITLLR